MSLPPHRRRLARLLATLAALAVLPGCSGVVHTGPAGRIERAESLVCDAGCDDHRGGAAGRADPRLDLDTQADEALQVHLSSPVVPGLPQLNESLRAEVGAELEAYRLGAVRVGRR